MECKEHPQEEKPRAREKIKQHDVPEERTRKGEERSNYPFIGTYIPLDTIVYRFAAKLVSF